MDLTNKNSLKMTESLFFLVAVKNVPILCIERYMLCTINPIATISISIFSTKGQSTSTAWKCLILPKSYATRRLVSFKKEMNKKDVLPVKLPL